jgi:hypothetical protein
MRHPLLLPAMNAARVRRTKPSSGSHTGRGRRIFYASLALPVLMVAPAIVHVALPGPARGDIDTVITHANFQPVHPPSRLYGPGALYVVEGGAYWKVCDADAELLTGKIEKSPTESEFREVLEAGGFSLGGKLVEHISATLGAARTTTVEYRVTEVAISSISLANLYGIQDVLLRREECDKAVGHLLDAKKQVCFGAAALSATIRYHEHDAAKFESSAAGREHSQGEIKTTGGEERSGQDLFYGIRLWPLCITSDTATAPSVLTEPPAAPAKRTLGAS